MDNKLKKNIVISAVNITNAGPFVILEECLSCLSRHLSHDYNIIALVNDKSRFKIDNIIFYEFPESKKSWFKRLYYEYFFFKKISLKLNPYLWLSLHDITPNVKTEILAVYCHHASCFYRLSYRDLIMDPKFALFHFFYKYLYTINIKKNNFVIVQQDWLRKKFRQIFALNNVIVAYPNIDYYVDLKEEDKREENKFKFFYPSLPRIFKNFEVICEATKILSQGEKYNFEVYLTISGNENRYSKYLYNKYKNLKAIKFIGVLPKDRVYEYYRMADCMIFPSKLESWGVPLTEFKKFGKPILAADLAYAHETIGDCDRVKFFNPDNPRQLSSLMSKFMEGELMFERVKRKNIEFPLAANWQELFNILLSKKEPDICIA